MLAVKSWTENHHALLIIVIRPRTGRAETELTRNRSLNMMPQSFGRRTGPLSVSPTLTSVWQKLLISPLPSLTHTKSLTSPTLLNTRVVKR
jgi:hypothetical protein